MKNIKQITWLLLLAIVGLAGACKKDPVMYNKGFTSFKFLVKDALGVEKQYVGTIADAEIVVELPTEVDVTNLKASFTLDNARTIVQVGKMVQENGVSANDFTQPITYTVKAEDKSTRSYSVRVTKKSAIKSFGFYMDDNPGLIQNYVGVIRGMAIEVGLPETVNLTTLVARFETTTGATLKVGAVVQESKKTVNDFTTPVIYQFSDANFPTPINFTVSTYFLGRQWSLVGDNLTGLVTASGIRMAIHPFSNNPYFIYQRTGKDESGIAIPTDNRKVAVIGYNGTAWSNLGNTTGISDFRADVPGIAFNSEGTLYVGYKDYLNSDNKATVLKYNGTAWSVVGTSRFSPVKVDYLSLAIAKNDMPMVSMAKNGTDNSGIPARGLYVAGFNGSSWNAMTPPGGIVVFYDQIIKGLDGNIYVGVMDRTTGSNKPSLFKYENNAWAPVGPTSFTAPDGLVGFQGVSIAVDKNSNAYLAYQVAPSSGRLNHVMKYNKEANTWQELGNAVSSGGEKDKFALCVDADGTLYFAYANASSLLVKTFNKNTNNWNTERKVISEKVNEFDMQVASDGTVYLVASITSDNRTVVYKYAK
ncbi:hypothetical protein [Pedobacter sp. ASV12]|uniref:hypothetical protein n=1 Tax=Pedobacter sp. ASV12 TaxID=2795120 RepID=UPI0018EDE5AA|nr:hypothetical protein [Pedobacter sp. ASV12]